MSHRILPKYLTVTVGVIFGVSVSAFATIKAAQAFVLLVGYKHAKINPIAWRDYLARPESFNAFNSAKNDWDATSTKVGFLYIAIPYRVKYEGSS